jgi:hypothetical protein
MRISDVGETALHTHIIQRVCVVGNQGTYGRWAGVQVRVSLVPKALSSFSTNNLSVYCRFRTP